MAHIKVKKKGLIIVVHFGKWIITEEFIDHIKTYLSEDLILYVVNNSPELLPIQKQAIYIEIINAPSNLGYFGGANYAFNYVDINNFDFIIICNNDIEIIDSNFFNYLQEKIDYYDIIAPSIETKEGIEQNPYLEGEFTSFRMIFYKLYFNNYLFAYILTKLVFLKKMIGINFRNKEKETERVISSPHGAFIIFNRTFFDNGGFIEDKLFLYGEEDSISAQAKSLKLKIGFVPSLKIIHKEHTTTKKGLSKHKYINQCFAYDYISKKYPDFFR